MSKVRDVLLVLLVKTSEARLAGRGPDCCCGLEVVLRDRFELIAEEVEAREEGLPVEDLGRPAEIEVLWSGKERDAALAVEILVARAGPVRWLAGSFALMAS